MGTNVLFLLGLEALGMKTYDHLAVLLKCAECGQHGAQTDLKEQ